MQTEHQDPKSSADAKNLSDGVVSAEASQEDSGLHDIKALAQTTRNRISRRQTSQHDIDETLLASSQSGLHAVALPDPAKMVQLPTVDEARALARSTAGMAAVAADEVEAAPARAAIAAPAAERGKGVPVWVWAGGGLAAAAAVIGFVVLGGKDAKEQSAPAAEPAVSQAESQPAGKAAVPPALDEGITTGGLAEDTPAADPAPVAAVQPEVAAEEEAEPVGAELKAKKDTARDRRDRDDENKIVDAKKDKAKPDDKADGQKDQKKDKAKDEKKAPPPDKKLEGAVLGEGDEDVLGIGDALTGGGKKKDDAPKRTELSSQELRDGLDAINGKAKACYGAHGQTGTVKVKLTISPSGKVTKASASGALAGTPAGDCVVSAVKSATFPAWEGSPKSTSYVVLLSD